MILSNPAAIAEPNPRIAPNVCPAPGMRPVQRGGTPKGFRFGAGTPHPFSGMRGGNDSKEVLGCRVHCWPGTACFHPITASTHPGSARQISTRGGNGSGPGPLCRRHHGDFPVRDLGGVLFVLTGPKRGKPGVVESAGLSLVFACSGIEIGFGSSAFNPASVTIYSMQCSRKRCFGEHFSGSPSMASALLKIKRRFQKLGHFSSENAQTTTHADFRMCSNRP